MRERMAAVCRLMLVVFIFCAGCSRDYLDPTQLGRFRPVPAVNVILESLGVADEPKTTYEGAEDPRPEDLIAYEQEYVFGVGDVARIIIYELFREGMPDVRDYVVNETGRISIPEVGQIRAAGLTERMLEDEIKYILSPSIIKDPSVTVSLMSSQSRTFTITGQGILGRSARYPLPRFNLRLSEAIAIAGGIGQHNISNIYVSREVTGTEVGLIPTEGPGTDELESAEAKSGIDRQIPKPHPVVPGDIEKKLSPEDEMLEIIQPDVGMAGVNGVIISSAEMINNDELETLALLEQVESSDKITSAKEADSGRIEWVFEDGKWIPFRAGPAEKPKEPQRPTGDTTLPPEESRPSGYGWDQIGGAGSQTRVIKIPVDKLEGGDPKYDILIRSGDRVSVPVDIIGEFWVMGNTRFAGPIPLTGRPITLKMAIATAGGLNAVAHPQKVEVIRRLGRNKAGLVQEETVLVDLDKISKGLQPDFFIKPFDMINVGTHGTSRYLAVLRNAFRATYGFGFIYDRNFAIPDFGRYQTMDLKRALQETF